MRSSSSMLPISTEISVLLSEGYFALIVVGFDNVEHPSLVRENIFIIRDQSAQRGKFLFEFFHFERGKTGKFHFENGVCLLLAQFEAARQLFDRFLLVAGLFDDLDDFVDIRKREHQPLDDMRPLFRLVEIVSGSADDDLFLMVEIVIENIAQVENFGFRTVFHKRQQNDSVRNLQVGMFIESVENDLRVRVFLALDHDTQALSARLFADVRNALQTFVAHHVCDRLDELRLVDLIGQLCHYDTASRIAARAVLLDVALGADDEISLSRAVCLADSRAPHDDTARRKVGRGDKVHELFHRDVGIVDHRDRSVDNFRKVVRGNVRRHADRDSVRSVDKQIGKARRKHRGFRFVTVEVGEEIHRLFVEIAQHFGGELRKARLRITHCRGGISVYRTEVSVSVHKRKVDGEILRETHERVVHRRIPVRVIFTQHVADDSCALAVSLVVVQSHFVHGEQNSSVHGFESVANVGNRAGFIDRHCIGDERAFQLRVHLNVEDFRHFKRFLKFFGKLGACFSLCHNFPPLKYPNL